MCNYVCNKECNNFNFQSYFSFKKKKSARGEETKATRTDLKFVRSVVCVCVLWMDLLVSLSACTALALLTLPRHRMVCYSIRGILPKIK